MLSSKAAPLGLSRGELAARIDEGLPARSLPTPVVTLSDAAVTHNVTTMAEWCREAGVGLAPHGKTTMSLELWRRQVDAGAWGITVATPWQLSVALEWGIPRVMLANALVQPAALEHVARVALAESSASEVFVWADGLDTVAIMAETLRGAGAARPLAVLVELGASGGRTGARSRELALEIARAVAEAPELRLAGVCGYEGALAHTPDEAALGVVRGYLEELRAFHADVEAAGLYPEDAEAIVTAGGSAYFDVVADVLAPLRDLAGERGRVTEVLLRSGAYITHDDGFYRMITPLARRGSRRFQPATHGWATVVSTPEPGLALVDAGKRDFPFDEGLPEPQLVRRRGADALEPLEGATVTALNDQHAFVSTPAGVELRVGDVIRFGLSHPCTTFDKWRELPLVDDVDLPEPRVLRFVPTTFG